MTPEQEAEVLKSQIAAAQAAGDIGTLLHLMVKTASLTPDDFIKKTVGSILFFYYIFVNRFNVRPLDLSDLVDGLLFIEAQAYAEEQHIEDIKRKHQQERQKK